MFPDLKFFTHNGECTEHMLDKIKGHLKRKASVIIIGKPGSGKTTLAWTVCKQMHGEIFEGKRWHVKTSTSIDNIPEEDAIILLLLDGLFESAWTTEGTVKNIFGEVEGLRSELPSKQIVAMLTLSNDAYKRISKWSVLKQLESHETIDLDDKTNTLTRDAMKTVLKRYDIRVKDVIESNDCKALSEKQLQSMHECFDHHSIVEKAVFTIPKLGFPLIAFLMSLNSCFLGNIDFIEEPFKHIMKSLKQFRESEELSDRNKYCTIVYASFKLGYLDVNNVDTGLLKSIGIQHDHPGAEIEPDVYILRRRTSTVYEFLHEGLLRAFFAAYGNKNLGFVINNCPVQVLLEYCISKRESLSDTEKKFYLTIGGTYYEKAFIKRIRNTNIEIRHHRIWEQERFKESFRQIQT